MFTHLASQGCAERKSSSRRPRTRSYRSHRSRQVAFEAVPLPTSSSPDLIRGPIGGCFKRMNCNEKPLSRPASAAATPHCPLRPAVRRVGHRGKLVLGPAGGRTRGPGDDDGGSSRRLKMHRVHGRDAGRRPGSVNIAGTRSGAGPLLPRVRPALCRALGTGFHRCDDDWKGAVPRTSGCPRRRTAWP